MRNKLSLEERVVQRQLSPDHFRAWLVLKRFGPLTAAQVSARAKTKSLHRRLSELRDAGLILEHGSTFCWKSYRHVLVWKALDRARPFSKLERDDAGTVWFVGIGPQGARAFSKRAEAERWGSTVIVSREIRRYAVPC